MTIPHYQHHHVEFTVPLLAPSSNHYVKHTHIGRHYVTGEARAFFDAVRLYARGQFVRFPWYAVEVWVTLGPKLKGDADNYLKCGLDALVKAGVIDSDAKVTDLEIHKRRGKESSTRYYVREGDNP